MLGFRSVLALSAAVFAGAFLAASAQIAVTVQKGGSLPDFTEANRLMQTPMPEVLAHSIPAFGQTPFHEVLAISGAAAAFSGSIQLDWLGPGRYRLESTAPGFHQLRIVDGTAVYEQDDGDFLPRWLDNFTSALLAPVPPALGRPHALQPGNSMETRNGVVMRACLSHDDRPGGITDQLTWAELCLGSGPVLVSIHTFNNRLEYSDFAPFSKQQVARTIKTVVRGGKSVYGLITDLQPLSQPEADLLTMPSVTAIADQIKTTFVSTLKEESLVEHAPTITWPTVREGKTEGYMIVYARTDRTGQVRETVGHDADNPALLEAGVQAALGYKFHPLIVDGVPQQMEMPLVLHFITHIADPPPTLTDPQTRALMHGCSLPSPKLGKAPFRIEVTVSADGKLIGEGFADALIKDAPHRSPFQFALSSCTFSPYVVNGQATKYYGELLLPAE